MNISKKNKLIIPIVALVLLITTSAYKNDFFEIAKQIEIFTTLYKEINMNYVDETSPSDLMNVAIKNMLSELDPYTVFFNEQDVEASRINSTGDYTGIGATIKTLKDRLIVIEPFKDYPADRAGLKAGDEILKVDNIVVADFQNDAGELLQGSAGSKVSVTYRRQGEIKSVPITRQEVAVKAVPLYKMVNKTIGYVALAKFTRTASQEVKNAVSYLKAEGAEQLVFDLRGNPGGLLIEAINIVNLFVPKNEVIVTTKSKVDKYNKTYKTRNEPLDIQIPLVVLIDGGSASASEIVSGSLQDLDRAVIIGSRSFGKGLVQRPKPLSYGTQLKVTISRYFTPSGRCIQALDYKKRDENGQAIRVREENYNSFKTKNGRAVFDGGGVMPDIELTESEISEFTKDIIKQNFVFNYATNYYYENSTIDLNTFKLNDADFSDFIDYLKQNNFEFKTKTETALNSVIKIAKEEGFDEDLSSSYTAMVKDINAIKDYEINNNKSQLLVLLENEIILRYFYREGLYKYYLSNNNEIQKATDILLDLDKYNSYLKP
ncbi:MAG: S41 family peptidase [Flavobacteriaceae bacterium]|jgi:carboxyl-terminal processing protease|nr:S41 family peptidase [Bacteroidota bacterium]MDC0956407.1 S41 family peptidase [Flavobacteriaceae bacterium]MDG1380373.1 S41 family peptidase [Flavobacteriaceae bacterium]MDG2349467.1 S41 family peptidase [Flavobacteriaceae bacterium]